MSKSLYIIFKSLVALTLGFSILSCSGVEIPGGENAAVSDYPVNIIAGAGADTRIAVDDLALTWESDDVLKLAAVATDGSSAVAELNIYKIDESNPSSAAFSGFVSLLAPPQECYFLYPNSSATSYNPATGRVKIQYNAQSGRHEPIMYAKTAYNQDGMIAGMKHVGAILELDVQISDLASITFAGNNLEDIYPVEVDPESGEIFLPNEVGVQITVPVQADSPTYICVPPVNLKKGFSLICSKADGSYLVKSFSSDGSVSGGYDFSTKVGSLIHIDLTGEFEDFSISAASLAGNHTRNGNLISGTEVNFVMNRKGVSNKLIEEWGANLLNSEGQVVRNISYTNATPISGQTVKMNVANNWKLLPAGDYIFTPYYKMYGQVITLPSQILNISDPGVTVKIAGNTSYDKYIAGNISGANSHSNTLIEGVAIETNLDITVIDSRDLTIESSSLGAGTWSSGKATYGNITKTGFKAYPCTATVTAGNLTFKVSRDFYITGLPYTGDFTQGNPTSWNPGWAFISTKYNSSRVVFTSSSAVRSPGFYIPQTGASSAIKVVTRSNCKHNVTSNSKKVTMTISSCASTATSISSSGVTLTIGSDYYQAAGSFGDVSGFTSGTYLLCNSPVTLTSSKSAVMFSVALGRSILGSNTLVSFGHKIEYN